MDWRTIHRVVPLCVVAVVLLVAGCGGVGDSPSTTTATTPMTTGTTLVSSPSDTTVEYWIADSTLRFQASESDTDCWSVTVSALLQVIDSRTEDPLENVRVGHVTTDEYVGYTVTHETVLNRDGQVVSSASVSYSRLQEIVPEAVNGTVTVDNRSTACTAPIRVVNRTIRQD